MGRRLFLTLLTALILAVPAYAKPAPKAPARTDWTRVVAATPAGGFVLGNPKAKVKLVEFGSLTCPHCRAFDEEGVPTLLGKYVKSGQVSWEFRNYVRDAADVTAALIARCNGARGFFPLMRALYKDQQLSGRHIDRTDLMDAIRGGEDSYLEFKVRFSNPEKLAAGICARRQATPAQEGASS